MKEIPLSQNGKKYKGMFVALVDDEDFNLLNKINWSISNSKNTSYAVTIINKRKVRMHRLLLNFSAKLIDHIDGNGLNNQKSNLRKADRSINSQNTFLYKNNTLGFRGISFHKKINKYEARIVRNYTSIYLGVYITAKEAAEAYNKKAIELYGPNARLNRIAS